ncbi:unnamed protein product [Kuraishia capsulata CBS 1993]|uniref:ribose-phosphate diphosphokinase n=1 Tax=Kuraishia capsulata CBS 1993 TaxID=1382522 RepID=W6MH18_9ASCO|nr:uncharacterized protein KUCA_T00001464001 [Kuraishia capsulata CBS 1993]CDK25494.1 unnamed protein product [Kuraishia capsulata CBS 1993]
MRDLLVFSGSSNKGLAERICRCLGVEEGEVSLSKFSNGETSVTMVDSVREKDVYIVQSGSGHVNDNFIEMLIMISACKMASAKRVTAVLPLFPYSRQPDVPYNRKGAPLVSKTKSSYTYDSVPSTPRPSSRNFYSASDVQKLDLNQPRQSGANVSNLVLSPAPLSPAKSPFFKSRVTSDAPADKGYHPTALPTNASSPGLKGSDVNSLVGYKQWIAQSGTLVANLLTTAGADHIITMDLHDPQFQGFFDIPVDNLYSKPLLQHYIANYIPNYQKAVIVSPDAGGAKRATSVADALEMEFALIHKERRQKLTSDTVPSSNSGTPSNGPYSYFHSNLSTASLSGGTSSPMLHGGSLSKEKIVATTMLVGDVEDKVCIIVDDLVDTSYTITRAAKLLKAQGAKYVYAIVTHGVFSGDALRRIRSSGIDKLVTTDSVPQEDLVAELGDMVEVLDVSRIFAEAIRRINNGESVSMLFDHGW